jgi:hypothetical protein
MRNGIRSLTDQHANPKPSDHAWPWLLPLLDAENIAEMLEIRDMVILEQEY